jgi:O-antigen ligase
MKISINIIRAHPFLGCGINNYAEVMQNYDDTAEGISLKYHQVVHNSYLLIASEIGILGLFFFICFVALIYKKGIEILRYNDKITSCIIIGMLAGISGVLIQFLVENVDLTNHLFFLFWVVSGVITALSNLNKKPTA